MQIRTRFSPSPTGMIHLGNARAALFSAFYARKHHGVFILRIEDTDIVRSEERFIELLKEDLHWLGIDWQEGLGMDGHYGPYRQSQRQAIYNDYFNQLKTNNLVYPCFCSDQELLLARKLQLSRGQAPRYGGTCRHFSQLDIERRIHAGTKPTWRFIVPEHTIIEFNDLAKGSQQFNSSDMGDFIIRRADGTAPFLFCNAIDDAMMKITHVIRGEDHVANTPRQILLFKALALPIPHYLARLGHTCDVHALLDFEHLAEHFYLDRLSKSPARFDIIQLRYWQKTVVQALDLLSATRWLGQEVLSQVPEKIIPLFVEIIKSNVEFPHDALEWAKILFHEHAPLNDEAQQIIREAGEQFFVEAEQAVDNHGVQLSAILVDLKQSLAVSGKKLFMPLRVALTGRIHGPELADIAELLGPEKMKHRLGRAVQIESEKR